MTLFVDQELHAAIERLLDADQKLDRIQTAIAALGAVWAAAKQRGERSAAGTVSCSAAYAPAKTSDPATMEATARVPQAEADEYLALLGDELFPPPPCPAWCVDEHARRDPFLDAIGCGVTHVYWRSAATSFGLVVDVSAFEGADGLFREPPQVTLLQGERGVPLEFLEEPGHVGEVVEALTAAVVHLRSLRSMLGVTNA